MSRNGSPLIAGILLTAAVSLARNFYAKIVKNAKTSLAIPIERRWG
jgi:hypothetical protein